MTEFIIGFVLGWLMLMAIILFMFYQQVKPKHTRSRDRVPHG